MQALLAVYNWRPDTDRYRRCVRFVEYLFERFDKLRVAPYQPGWKEMNLAGTIPGWTRFPPAQEMLEQRSRRGPRSIQPLRARRRPAPRPTVQPSRSGCSSNSWNGASNRSDKPPLRPSGSCSFTGAAAEGKKIVGRQTLLEVQGGGGRSPPRCVDARATGRSRMRPLLRLAMALAAGTVVLLAGDPETGGRSAWPARSKGPSPSKWRP